LSFFSVSAGYATLTCGYANIAIRANLLKFFAKIQFFFFFRNLKNTVNKVLCLRHF